MCISVPNMKFLCLTMCQGEVCTDDANDDGQSMIVQGSLVDKPNEPIIKLVWMGNKKYFTEVSA